jgi:hypothetical protein
VQLPGILRALGSAGYIGERIEVPPPHRLPPGLVVAALAIAVWVFARVLV